jgi:ABC-type transport system substrate-binding protein
MVLYSRVYFNGFAPEVDGIINSMGYGSDNSFTHMKMNTPTGTVTWAWGEEPERLNYMYASTVYAVDVIEKTQDGLLAVSPYDHSNIPWIATSWTTVETPGDPISPMHVVFNLRDDVYWQDGRQFTANDVKFCLEFLRDYQIPQWKSTWESVVNVTVNPVDDFEVTVFADRTSQFLPDYYSAGAILPPQVWDRDWENWPDPGRTALENILSYDPTVPYNVAPGYTAGPNPPPTNLFGTGPFVFDYYDRTNMVGELYANDNYFMATTEIHDYLVNLLWSVGDVDAYNPPQADPGWVWANDKFRYGASYATIADPYADLNEDGIVDVRDGVRIGYHIGDRLEYP